MTFISYLELYIVISPEKQGNGVAMDATAVHSSMHRSLEDVVFWDIQIINLSVGEKKRKSVMSVLDHRAN